MRERRKTRLSCGDSPCGRLWGMKGGAGAVVPLGENAGICDAFDAESIARAEDDGQEAGKGAKRCGVVGGWDW